MNSQTHALEVYKSVMKDLEDLDGDAKLIEKREQQDKHIEQLAEAGLVRAKAKEIVRALENHLGVTEISWDRPYSWELTNASELQPGDGVLLKSTKFIVIKRMAWWRSKTANILCSQETDPTKYLRIGTIDIVQAYKGYVNAKRKAQWGIDVDNLI